MSSAQDMQAVILVGGPGMRLRPLTDNCPKPIVPVLNRPFLEHTLALLQQFDITDVVLAMSYLPEAIQKYFGDGKKFGTRLTYCLEKDPLGTAGAVKNAASYLDGTFLVLNGDNIFSEIDLQDMLAFHRGKKAEATLALTWVADPSAFGVIETDANQRIKRFIEKPPPGTETSNWINAGCYILEPDVLARIPSGKHYMFENGLFPDLLENGRPVYGYHYEGYWLDMGTPQKYFNYNMDLLQSKTKSPLFREIGNNGVYYIGDNVINPAAEITGPVIIDRGCKVGSGVCIKGPSVIGRECVIRDGADLEKVILWDNIKIGTHARLDTCIIGSDTSIEDNQNVRDSVVTSSGMVPLSVP